MQQFFKIFTVYVITIASLLLGPVCWAKKHTVLVMGDSLSAGFGMSLEQATQQTKRRPLWRLRGH